MHTTLALIVAVFFGGVVVDSIAPDQDAGRVKVVSAKDAPASVTDAALERADSDTYLTLTLQPTDSHELSRVSLLIAVGAGRAAFTQSVDVSADDLLLKDGRARCRVRISSAVYDDDSVTVTLTAVDTPTDAWTATVDLPTVTPNPSATYHPRRQAS